MKRMPVAILMSGVILGALGCNSPAATFQPSGGVLGSVVPSIPATAAVTPTAATTASPTPVIVPSPVSSSTPGPTSTATSLTGEWSGSWTNSPDFGTPPATGNLQVSLVQTGTTFTGDATISGSTCVTGGPSSGTIVGNQITFGFQTDPERPVTFAGTIAGDTMSGTWNAIACDPANIPIYGTWELTRNGAASPSP